ncbi:hypothetical protein [Saccharococcus sp. Marseille-Q5394]|uniref:hypothetical protein n=1 Tax=Saccharococcus sp. Marseille-Q5394 TaxID=2972778 RepID=UPI0021C58A6F|nr:hypothetical protein [Saccharococcus sp. Marseille-Q5394]
MHGLSEEFLKMGVPHNKVIALLHTPSSSGLNTLVIITSVMVVICMESAGILAGPMLRRVDTESVAIWVATDCPVEVNAAIYCLDTLIQFDTDTKTTSIRAGHRLFIHLVQVHGQFPTETLLGYDLLFRVGKNIVTLASLGLIHDNEDSITYDGLPYPSFFIPASAAPTFLYASCRKFHGKGDDALVAADALLHRETKNLAARPCALFLTGDQIYADDVADPLFPVIRTVAEHYIGKEDLWQFDLRLRGEPFSSSLTQVNGRQFITERFCRFTSGNASNHLLTFGEYAAMYLLSWSPSMWAGVYLPTFDELVREGDLYLYYPDDHGELERCRVRFEEQAGQLLQAIGSLHRIRRLFANVPTYMIFDDHDVTDDWNLSADWRSAVLASPLGKHVIANGLCAYWAFQGWGNEPQRFGEGFLQSMCSHFDGFIADSTSYKVWANRLWSFNGWQFVAPTTPAALFLDTRTMRQFEDEPKPVKVGRMYKESVQTPRLIGTSGWKVTARTLLKSRWTRGDPLIIVSPTPLYGLGLIESVLHSYVYPLRTLGFPIHEVLDFEAWKYNGRGFTDFIGQLFHWSLSRCIILSGDVHYASGVRSRLTSKREVLDILQFTSSPSHNMSFSGVWGKLMKMAIWGNARRRVKKTIYRYCDVGFSIRNGGKAIDCPKDAKWQEALRYLEMQGGAIVETENNIGLVTVGETGIRHSLLQMVRGEMKEIRFEDIEASPV